MVEFQTVTLREKIPFEANAFKVLKLPRVGFVTRIELLLRLNVTTDPNNGGTPKEDALARILKSVRIEVPGGDIFFGVPDGRLLKLRNIIQFGKVHESDLPTAAGVTEDVYGKYIIHFGKNYTDPFDPTVVVPAEDIPDWQLYVLWGDASDLGSGYTINSGEITVTIQRIKEDEPGEIFEFTPVMPVQTPVEISIDETVSELGLQHDIPIGNVLDQILILVVDSNDNKSDGEVSEVGVLKPKERRIPYRIDWKTLTTKVEHDYGLQSYIPGFGVIDGEDIADTPIGLDLSMAEVGDYKLGFSTLRTGGKIKLVYEQLRP